MTPEAAHQILLQEVAAQVRDTERWTQRRQLSALVMAALERVPRQAFVPPELVSAAYDNTPLPIGHGQTISQPYIVALMTDLLELETDDVVLEIGTGSGYQAAVLSQLAQQIYSVEVIEALASTAQTRLERLGCTNVQVRCSDGALGWPEHAPYDAIIVTAAPEHLPTKLLEQLKPGGRMVIPVGRQQQSQDLLLLKKDQNGKVSQRSVLPVAFVPLVSK